MKRLFKYLTLLFLILIVYPVQITFFILKVAGMFLTNGSEQVLNYCHSLLSTIDK